MQWTNGKTRRRVVEFVAHETSCPTSQRLCDATIDKNRSGEAQPPPRRRRTFCIVRAAGDPPTHTAAALLTHTLSCWQYKLFRHNLLPTWPPQEQLQPHCCHILPVAIRDLFHRYDTYIGASSGPWDYPCDRILSVGQQLAKIPLLLGLVLWDSILPLDIWACVGYFFQYYTLICQFQVRGVAVGR